MNNPLVSIIIPTYNRVHLIKETLDSIIKQTYINWECIIVDDGSTDNTTKLIDQFCKKDKRFKFYKRPKNSVKGANTCRNYGLNKSRGTLINFFDSDDLMLPKKLEIQVKSLINSKLNLSVCQTLIFENNKKNILGLRSERIYSKDFFNDFITNDIKWLTQAPIINKSFLIDNNIYFDENLAQSQEREFFIKVLSKIDDYLFTEEPLVLVRKHQESITYSKMSESKLHSNFSVNFNTLINFKEKLTKKSKLRLKKAIKSVLKTSVEHNYNKLAYLILKKIFNKNIFKINELSKIVLGVFALKYFKKGNILFK